MKKTIYLPYFLIISALLANLIIYGGLIKIFFNMDSTIIAGVIAFIGAVIGGGITYLGVNKTLEHRNTEVFLHNATEKLMLLDILFDTYSGYLNQAFIYEQWLNGESVKRKMAHAQTLSTASALAKQLKSDKENMYKSMEYDAIEILSFYQKSLEGLTKKENPTEVDIKNGIEKIRDVFQVFHTSKEQLEKKYRSYRKRN